jgi:hypothetical protein
MKDKVYKVTIWFTNGETRVIGATKYFYGEGILEFYHPQYGVTTFFKSRVSGFNNPMEFWEHG